MQIVFEKGRATSSHHHDDTIDQWRLRNEPREFGIAKLVHALRGRIDRVLRGAIGGQVNVDCRARLFVEHRHIKPGGAAGVGHPDARAARRRANADAVSGRHAVATGKEADREVDHLVKVAPFDQSIALEDGAIGGLRTCERGGVRRDRAAAGLRLADLSDDQRLAGLQRLFRRRA